MTTLVRWAACALLAAAVFPAFARSPMSNEVGDGEANVPFATQQLAGADETLGGGSGEPGRALAAIPARAEVPVTNGCGDGEANVPFATSQPAAPDELGGGSGEPGRIETRDAAELARQAEADREFLSHVWTDP